MVRRTDYPAMTIAVDLGCKATKKTFAVDWTINANLLRSPDKSA